MRRYLITRFLYSIVALIGATAIVFSLSRAVGDPRYLYAQEAYGLTSEAWEDLGRRLGLDKPLVAQYFIWLGNVARGDLGESLIGRKPVIELIGNKVGNTLQLGLAAWLLATGVGIPLGILSAVRRGTVWDYLGRGFAALGQAAPPFWIGIMAILFFAVKLGWLPAGTKGAGASAANIKYFIMPAVTLAWLSSASYLRITRTAMLEILDSEFVKFAGKGYYRAIGHMEARLQKCSDPAVDCVSSGPCGVHNGDGGRGDSLHVAGTRQARR